MFTKLIQLILCVFILSLLPSCDDNEQVTEKTQVVSKKIASPAKKKDDLKAAGATEKENKLAEKTTGTLKKEKKLLPEQEYKYNPVGKADPFLSPFIKKEVNVTKQENKKRPVRRKPQTPLEKIAISQLKLVSILIAESGNKAVVEESSGRGYIIKVGTYIGLNSGVVKEISKNKIVIEEKLVDMFNKVSVKKRDLKLRKAI